MREILKTHFGYDAFRPLQEEIMNAALRGEDALVLMPTGGGKSLCYQLPALLFDGVTLVISPLIALMKDQVDALVANGIAAAFLNSSLTDDEMDSVRFRALSGELKILYVAPERLASYGFQDFLRQLRVSLIAVDEAHCISEWGHDFRPDYRNLKDLRRAFPDVPVMALTATATPKVREDIVAQLGMPSAPVFVSSFNRPNLNYVLRQKQNAFAQLAQLLETYREKPVIIYCFSRKDTESLAESLCAAGFRAAAYHAGLDRETRARTQDEFIRDEVSIIVATIAFGMGIDKPDVRLVAHMDLPKSIEGYYQETGRAGRDGLPSECVLFYSFGDKRKQDFFIGQIAEEAERELARAKLAQVIAYGETDQCRRKFLLEYFGEPWDDERCGSCDNCVAQPKESRDVTELAHKVFEAVMRTGERFGAAHVCDVLRGSRKERIVQNRHDTLTVHGTARDVSVDLLREVIRLMQKQGYLQKNDGDYPTLCVSQYGRQAFEDGERILLPISASEPVRAFAKPSRNATAGGLAFDQDLFDQLRRERKAIADEHNVPPFIIFGDRTLQEMAFYFPQSRERLATIFGVGARKLDAFGELFLAVIRGYATERGLAERPNPRQPVRPMVASAPRRSSTISQTGELVRQGLSLEQIMVERKLSAGTIIQHVTAILGAGEDLDIESLRPSTARLTAIGDAFRAANTSFLTPVKEILGNDFSYDEIRLARLFLTRDQQN
ncbi:ATP-dependent DNA helicase RecQ [Candidatus Uhrbacteria bacterium RIFOXYB12_FULL_58_10]|uniref:DNA helicase RecQ n=1 Tax=Candidatus Uhrbacteria bacterium RIFOXYB2_FULL_57_15 TaxID=1802422 RepID=A0A1F7W7I2_9BACT|nr:MAG: ATP-dependent DNA helicase RecQ [Candidatus Uhrbacteria bacterium RIFOXYB12_FULL_58_10]OGL98740.1 MAG: ATP-dependent DNA helicase RecQ [Candidatus Uhrbacteria bacterium RIFOXYB2_FULL_57_15]OGL99945.1 MAG: ATP-dependent DNA helicase RecQ [Candidatus Uhrbacteria bacterium RIFOXYC12_FULL_57_11]